MLRVAEVGRRPYSQTVLVADDSPVVRLGLADVINASPGMVISGLAASAESAIELAGSFHPDEHARGRHRSREWDPRGLSSDPPAGLFGAT
jgi:hypothetical protein